MQTDGPIKCRAVAPDSLNSASWRGDMLITVLRRSFSQMTGVVMETHLTPFSLLNAIKGNTKRQLLSITLNSPHNNFETLVLTHEGPRGEISESTYRPTLHPPPTSPPTPPWEKTLISSDVWAKCTARRTPGGRKWDVVVFVVINLGRKFYIRNEFASDEFNHDRTCDLMHMKEQLNSLRLWAHSMFCG